MCALCSAPSAAQMLRFFSFIAVFMLLGLQLFFIAAGVSCFAGRDEDSIHYVWFQENTCVYVYDQWYQFINSFINLMLTGWMISVLVEQQRIKHYLKVIRIWIACYLVYALLLLMNSLLKCPIAEKEGLCYLLAFAIFVIQAAAVAVVSFYYKSLMQYSGDTYAQSI